MVGSSIKSYRKAMGLTLQELANRTGLSVGYLSNLERDQTSPTLENLCLICDSLMINVAELISKSMSFSPLVKKDERKPIFSGDQFIHYSYTSDQNQDMVGLCLTIDKDFFGTEASLGHEVDEFGVICQGSLLIEVGDQSYLVEEGDSIYIKANTPHKWRKISGEQCISYWVIPNTSRSRSMMLHHMFEDGDRVKNQGWPADYDKKEDD